MNTEKLRSWFLENRRSFPWRDNTSPYAVWVSEVMLQQTRASVVVDYFISWMDRFPTIESLAEAPEEVVIKQWEGLGYYSRARNLHRGAKEIVRLFAGRLPNSEKELLSIPGIGPYTAGAILSFAFGQRACALDGNVMRVLARFTGFDRPVQENKRELTEKLLDLLPHQDAPVVMEGLIELGALVCTKAPKCEICPLKESCKALSKGLVDALPVVKQRPKTTLLERVVFCIHSKGRLLLVKNRKGVMQDLWEFPFLEHDSKRSISSAIGKCEKKMGLSLCLITPLATVSHTFTRYKAELTPLLLEVDDLVEVEGHAWISWERLGELPFSSGHKRIVQRLEDEHLVSLSTEKAR